MIRLGDALRASLILTTGCSGLNQAPEITSAGAYEVAENRAVVGRILKVSGGNPFLAYGVVPGERSGDGAYLPATYRGRRG